VPGQNRSHRRTLTVAAVLAFALALALASPVAYGSSPGSADSVPGSADSVITWDRNAQAAIWDVAGQQPWVQGRSFAMVHGAIYDAVNAIAGTPYQPYLVAPRAGRHASTDAAVATAAYRVLLALFPDQETRLRAQYDDSLAAIPDGAGKRSGISVGRQAAAAMVAARQNDGSFGDQTWVVGTRPGQWRPTPPTFAADGAWVAHVKPFLIPSVSPFLTSGPPALTSAAYARDLNEVKAVGAANSMVRTPDQTDAAIWWHDRRLTEWEIKRQLAAGQHLDVLQAARMFAMVDLAQADAAIVCFTAKATWSFWRPVTAVQLADTDGNPATVGDPAWMPLLITPPFPDYTSGHACASGASMSMFRTFFHRDDIAFSAFSEASGTTRHFTGFSQALTEVINARVWGGIHFRSADIDGARIGAQVTKFVARHAFRPMQR
jgi:hypothetical protein